MLQATNSLGTSARIISLTFYAVQRGDFIFVCVTATLTVFRAVGPRAAVRLDGDDIWAELRSVSIVALEEAVGCVRDGSSGCNSIPSSLPTVPVTYCGGSKVFCIIMSMPM